MDDMDRREVKRFLGGIESGTIPTDDCFLILEQFDPLLSFFLLRFLREKYPITGEAIGAGERLFTLLKDHPQAAKLATAPTNEPMLEWFDDTHSMGEFFQNSERFVDTIVDKLEG